MKPKERVLTALNHQQPDRTPCNYLGTPESCKKLTQHFKTNSMDEVLKMLGVDLRIVEAPYVGPKLRKWDDGRWENIWGSIRKTVRNAAGEYNEAVEHPYSKWKTIEDVENHRWPQVDWFDFAVLSEICDRYSDYAIIYGAPGNMDLINGTSYGMGVEKVLLGIGMDDPIVYAAMEKRFQCCYAFSEAALKAANGKIDILWIGDDFGTQKGLLLHPRKFRRIFYPKVKAMCDLGHKYGCKVMLHSCGSTRKIWNDLIEAGVDIYDTIQPEAATMVPTELKQEFGDCICFHGAVSTQKTLPYGSPEDVKKEVEDRLQNMAVGGGYICAPSHNIQPDTPIENILCMFETVRNFSAK